MTEKHIFKKIIVNASISSVWNKWVTEEGIKSFFAPSCNLDLVIDGAFELYFLPEQPFGLRGSEGCKILSYVPQQMLSFSWNAPPQFELVRGHHTWVVLLFNKMEDTLVELELYHLGWQKGKEWDNVYQYFLEAWDVVFKRLKASLN